jgi:4-hydroxybenzoate polyprenyltransferase
MPVKCLDRRARKSLFLGIVGRQSWPAAETETAASILWFAAIQGIKRKQDLADLARKGLLHMG